MTNLLARVSRPKVPLDEAADLLQELTRRVDDGEDLTAALVSVFHETRLDLAEAVDRRIAFDAWIKGAIATVKGVREEYAAKVKRLEVMYEAFKEHTRRVIESHPDLPYRGRLGQISVQKNPPRLVLAFGAQAITPDMIKFFGINDSYVKTEVSYSIDTAKVKADLLSGAEIPWAALDQGSHVRFRK